MKQLNLVDESKSDIKYKISQFPDGQQQVTILDYYVGDVIIKSRLNDFSDLELICCAVASLKQLEVSKIHLYVPYFLGSRSDRKFENGGNNYLKDVICPIINNLNINDIVVLDPHSDVLEACLNGFKKVDNGALISFAINDIYPADADFYKDCITLISPDAGALKKIYEVGEKTGIQNIVTCSKVRENGKIVKTEIPEYDFQSNPVIIIDDICDGGRTFIEIAKVLKERNCKGIYLCVTHGILARD